MNTGMRRLGVLGASAVTLVCLTGPASAADPDFVIDFPRGEVCAFPLTVAGSGEGPQVSLEFSDKDGRLRTLTAGTGYALTYTNVDTGASISSMSNGGVQRTQHHADDSQTIVLTGHNVVFMFPTDVPGPSTTLYTGRAVIRVAPDGTWTLERASGTKLDICAELASSP